MRGDKNVRKFDLVFGLGQPQLSVAHGNVREEKTAMHSGIREPFPEDGRRWWFHECCPMRQLCWGSQPTQDLSSV